MLLKGRDAVAYLRRPDPALPALFICGEDPVRVTQARADAVAALLGPGGEGEMRLSRMSGADLRKDPALLQDAMRETGFFPGQRVVLVEDATDSLAETCAAALEAWRPGDAVIVVAAGGLTGKSPLRKLFEGHPRARAVVLYDDPPGPEEIARMVEEAGLPRLSPDARGALANLARALTPGDFRQTVEKLSLYKRGDPAEVTADDIAAVAPLTWEAEVDELIAAILDRQEARIPLLLARVTAQGSTPVSVVMALSRTLRQVLQLSADPAGPEAAAGRVRIAGDFRRRQALVRQAGAWDADALGRALGLVVDTDLTLRSAGQTAPQQALVERLLIRLARLR